MNIYGTDLLLLQQSETFRSISNRNNITKLIIISEDNISITEFLVNLCSRLQHLTIHTSKNGFNSILQYLLPISNTNTRHLSTLYIENVSEDKIRILHTLIESEKRLVDYSIHVKLRRFDNIVYLRW